MKKRKNDDKNKEKVKIKLESVDEVGEFVENMIDTVREPLLVLDQDLRVIKASRSFYEFFKVSSKETIGTLIYDLGNQQWDIPKLRELLEKILPQKSPFNNFEVEHDFSKIGKHTMLLNARQIERALGKEKVILLAIEDITERKLLINLLTESEERFRRLFETAHDGILLIEKDEFKISYANASITRILGYSIEECIGRELKDIGFPDDLNTFKEILLTMDKNGIYLYEDALIHKKTGQVIYSDIYMVDKTNLIQCNIRDITERKQADEKLIESEDKYRSLIENIEEIIYFTDTVGKIVHISPQVSRYGYTPDDLLSMGSFIEIIFSEDVERVIAEYKHAMTTGEVYPSEYRILDHWGKVHWVETRSRTVRDASGNIIGNTGVLRDIGERKQAEKDLQISELKYRNQANFLDIVIENSPFAMHVMDAKGVIIRTNQALRDILNLTDDMIVGKYNVLHDENINDQELMPVVEAVFNDMKSARFIMFWTGTKAGDVDLSIANDLWIDVSMFPITDEAGKLLNVVCQYVDITERKRAEEALRESTRKLKEAQEMVHLGFWSHDVKSGEVEWSEEVFKILGLDPGTFTPQIDSILAFSWWPDGDGHKRLNEIINHTIETQTRGQYEQMFRRTDNSVGYYYSTFQGKFDKNGELDSIVGTLFDITERKKADLEIKKLNEGLEKRVIERTAELQNVNKELEAFSYSVSHDLRAPLRAIDGFTRILLQDYVDKLDDEAKRLGSVIQRNSRKMGQLIDDLLAFSRLGRAAMKFSVIDMKDIANSVYLESTNPDDRKRISFSVADLPKANGDSNMFHQVWTNLISNAIKFSSKLEQAKISISYQEDEKTITYCIKDNGVGFNMKYIDTLFSVFQRLHSEKEFPGTGVGLALVKRIIQRHGGRTWAEAEIGKGAAFYFSLPKNSEINGGKQR
jgi:PAS domain S-box-containing protein